MVMAPDLYKPRKRWRPSIAAHLLANAGICPAILAADLGLSERFVIMVQRKLGLRKLTSPNEYRKPRTA
jgi:hypothetical protein